MSISVSRHASPRVLKITCALTAILSTTLFAQQAAPVKTSPDLTISSKVSSARATQTNTDLAAQKKAELQYLHLPLSFEKNEGQVDARVKFLSRGAGYGLFLTDRDAVLSFGGHKASSIKLRFLNANSNTAVGAIDRLPGTSNYFLGNDRSRWHTNVPNFRKVEYKNLYSGIDLVYYGNQQKIEHDFVVAPQADASKIKFAIDGAKKIALDKSGDMVVTIAAGELLLRKPAIYQTINGERKEIAGGYALKHRNEVSFVLGAYDRTRELTIDPVLILSTYFGGNTATTTTATGVVVGTDGIYVVGTTNPTTLPPSGATSCANCGTGGTGDIYVLKTDLAGSSATYTTYVGGTAADSATGIAIDASGHAYVTGATASTDFPTTTEAFQSTFAGGAPTGFVLKLSSTGDSLAYSTYLGGAAGNAADTGNGIGVDASGNAYVAGTTGVNDFPVTTTAVQSISGGGLDAFVASLSTNPATIATAIRTANVVTITTSSPHGFINHSKVRISGVPLGTNSTDFRGAFDITFVDAMTFTYSQTDTDDTSGGGAASALLYGTYLGGTSDEHGNAIRVVDASNVYVAGDTASAAFPTAGSPFQAAQNGATIDGFVSKLDTTASGSLSLFYSTYLGGNGDDFVKGIAVDSVGNAYITGSTTSTDTTGALCNAGATCTVQQANGGGADAFVVKLDNAASNVLYSTYLGGVNTDGGLAIALDSANNAYIAGFTQSDGIFNVNALIGTLQGTQDGFVAKINPTGAAITYSTYLGATGSNDTANAIAINSAGANSSNVPVAVVAGNTFSSQFPSTASALQSAITGTQSAFLASLDSAAANAIGLTQTGNVSPDPIRVDAGSHPTLSYQFTVQNGDLTKAANSVVFNDPMPLSGSSQPLVSFGAASGTVNTGSPTPVSCSQGSGGITCQIGTLAQNGSAGDTATITFTATPTAAAEFPNTTIVNTASAATAETASVSATATSNIIQETDVATSFTTTNASPVQEGTLVTYVVTVTNNGAGSANDLAAGKVSVSGSLAGTNSFVTVTSVTGCSNAASTSGSNFSNCQLGALANGSSVPITVQGTAHVTAGITSPITLSVTAAPTNVNDYFDTVAGNDTATTTLDVQPIAKLITSVTTSAAATTANNATGVQYTVSVNNQGPNDVSSAHITGSLGNVIVSLSAASSSSPGCTVDNTAHTFDCSNVTIANAATFAVTFTGTAIETTGKQQLLTVSASVSPQNTGDFAFGSGSVTSNSDNTVTVQPVAKLITNVTTTATAVTANNTAGVQYTVTVQNQGPDDISTGHITGSLGDVNVSLSAASSSTGACIVNNIAQTFDCSNVSINNLATFSVTLTGTATETTGKQQILTISATVAPQTAGDFALGNGSVSSKSSNAVTVQPVAKLITNVTTAAAATTPNNTTGVQYTVIVQNQGPDSISTAHVSGSLGDANVSLSGAVSSLPSCTVDNAAHAFDCSNLSIGNAATFTVTFTGTAAETTGKQQILTVSATVASQTVGDFAFGLLSVPSNSNATVNVQPVADVSISNITGPALVSNNGTATYTVVVTNNGPDDVSTAQVTGTFSGTGVTFTNTGSSVGCTFVGQSFTCAVPRLSASTAATVNLVGTATETNGKQTILSLGSISVGPATVGDYKDANSGNNSPANQPFLTNVQPVARLITTVTTAATSPIPNNSAGVQYTLTVANQGPDNLATVDLTGSLGDANVSLASASSSQASCSVNNVAHSFTCLNLSINNGAAFTVTFTGTTIETTGKQQILTVSAIVAPHTANDFAFGTGSVPNTSNNSLDVQPHANISSVFTAKAPNPFATSSSPTGQTYIVVATNSGPDIIASSLMQGSFATSNATVNITSVSGAGGDICTHTQTTYQCTLTTFAIGAGSSHSFTIIANIVLNPGSTSGSVTNNVNSIGPANVGDFANDDPQSGGTSAFSAIQGQANLAFNFSASSTTPKVGDTYTYIASVTNAAGASDAAGVNVTVNLFPGQTFLPASSSPSCSGTITITCAMGTAVAGAPASVTTIAVLASPALVPPSASGNPRQVAFSQSASVSVDTNQTVNIGASSAPAINLTARAAAHITVAHTNPIAPVLINGTGTGYPDVTYSTQVTNVPGPNGSSVAQNVLITDTPPNSSNATLKSVSISGSGNFCDLPSGGQITCHILSLASGGTETLSVTVTPLLFGNGSQSSITDLVNYTLSDVVDPGPPGGTSDSSTIKVQNTMTGGLLPLTDTIRTVALTFGTVTTTGSTTFSTSSAFGTVNLPAGYPLGIQPAGALLYNFSTTATITTPTTFCINNTAQTFAKPERVRVFLVSAGAPLDITSSITPGNPTPPTGVTMACGRTSFSNGSLTLAMLEPANNAPVLNSSNATPVTPFLTQGVTGQIILDASSADDPDNNVCNGGPAICRDKDQLAYRWTTSNPLGFTNANKNPIGATLTTATPSNIFLPLGKNQTITLTVTDQLGATASNSFVRNIVNTPALSVADVLPVDGEIAGNPTPVAVRFFNVAVDGVTKLNTQAASSAPSGYRFGTNGMRYNISTDATINGNTQLCVDVSSQGFVKPERVRLIELAPTFSDMTASISPVPTIPSKGQVVNQVCGILSGFSTGLVQVAALEPVNNAPVIGLTFNLSASQDAGKGVTGNFVDLNLATSFDPDTNPCNGNSSTCSDTPQLRFFVFGPFPGALQATSANPIIRNVSLPGGTTTVTIVSIDQTITVPSNAVISAPSDLANLPGAAGQNGLTTTQFPVTIDSTTPGGGSTGNTATILAGQSASFIFTPVNPNGGALQGSGTLNLSCSNGPSTPSLDSLHITCNITPLTFTIGSSSAPALLVSTTGSTLAMTQPSTRPGAPLYAVWLAFVGMPFAGIVIISISGSRRRWLKILLGFGLLALAIGSQVACGGGSSMAPNAKFSTPRGTYEIVVTGTQNGTTLSKNSFTITVQ